MKRVSWVREGKRRQLEVKNDETNNFQVGCVDFFLNFIFEMKNSSNHYVLVLSINPKKWVSENISLFSVVCCSHFQKGAINIEEIIYLPLFPRPLPQYARQQWMFIGFPFRIINYSINSKNELKMKFFTLSHFMLNVTTMMGEEEEGRRVVKERERNEINLKQNNIFPSLISSTWLLEVPHLLLIFQILSLSLFSPSSIPRTQI